jgi:hypothetical protein
MISTTDTIKTKIENIYRSLHNSQDLAILTSKELNEQTDKLKSVNEKSNTIYQNLLISRNKLNKIALSLPEFNITFPFFKRLDKNADCNNIVIFEEEHDEMDKISYKLNKLKNIANDINIELKRQNTMFEEITTNNDSSFNVILQNNEKIEKLL